MTRILRLQGMSSETSSTPAAAASLHSLLCLPSVLSFVLC